MWGPEVDIICLPIQISSLTAHLTFLLQSFSLNLELINWLGRLASGFQGSSCLCLLPILRTGIADVSMPSS